MPRAAGSAGCTRCRRQSSESLKSPQQRSEEVLGHQVRHFLSIAGSVDLDDANVQPLGITDRVFGDQPVARDPVLLGEFGVADVAPETAGA